MIPFNNAASELRAAEEAEELVVLGILTRMVAQKGQLINEGLDALTRIDLASARAKHAEYALFIHHVVTFGCHLYVPCFLRPGAHVHPHVCALARDHAL